MCDSDSTAVPAASLGHFFEFSFHGSSGVPDVPHRFGEPFLRYTEFVGPVLNFVRLEQADAASVLRTFVRDIVGHSVVSDLTFNAL
jgi:hypothetical protein